MNENLYLVMPAYNEEANISKVIEQWYPIVEKIGNNSKLVVVDDGSKDQTYAIMLKLTEKYPALIPLTKSNSGHGVSCLYAYNYAIDNGGEWIFQTDSDGQTDPGEFWDFWQNREQFDFIIGTRKNRMDGLGRVFVTKVLKLVILIMSGSNIRDGNTPFRLMKASELKRLLQKIPKDAFLSNVLISISAVKNNQNACKWLPITFKPRQGGINSINFKRIIKIGIKALYEFREFRRLH